MNNTRFFLFLLFIITISITPVFAIANIPLINSVKLHGLSIAFQVDSIPKKQAGKQDDKKINDKKPEIKEVPKSKRQPKPAVVKTKIKIKTPIKRIKPVIKRPVRLIRKNLGL